MFGEMVLEHNGNVVRTSSKHAKKVWGFLEYLFAHRHKIVTLDEVVEVLWPSEEERVLNPANTLKTILFRARTLLNTLQYDEDIIAYSRGSYQIYPNVEIVCDFELFDELIKEAQKESLSDEEKLELMLKALEYYKNDFLVKSAYEAWVIPLNTYYRSIYIKAILDVVALLEKKENWSEIITICHEAISIDPYFEDFHRLIINALVKSGSYSAAIDHYSYITNFFFTQLGITPSEELTSLYKQVRQVDNVTEMDLVAIRESLNEIDSHKGAFYCEYEFFKDVYRIEVRTAARNGHSAYIGLLSVTGLDGEKLSLRKLNNAMNMLYDAIQETLRRSDVFTRYSVSQYLIMISTVSFETGEMVVDRILQKFYKDHPKSSVKIDLRIQPLVI